MTLLFDDSKRLEKALGEEAAGVLISILEKQDEDAKREIATKHDLRETELRLLAEMAKLNADTKADILKWVAAMLIGQAALIAALMKLFTK
ncbi:hypothetical protein [Solidesulfovibrio magneticus]|uniref:DUF1640 domain-containing protein n=1 Tax=Solidesulfovibrio magneticus (strain ATCC 700980 / DSM 13731 / RS-1) TaxID=573370 RepID=C4XRU2_SOLM1|nr:hypothetical protein [Solidesulfovibrio magneticus]BAH78008.1 hypothetical protein DMR_45170 [Solidesulfovibrio magneticus RS-1]